MKIYENECEYNFDICEVCSEILKPKEEVESVLKVFQAEDAVNWGYNIMIIITYKVLTQLLVTIDTHL